VQSSFRDRNSPPPLELLAMQSTPLEQRWSWSLTSWGGVLCNHAPNVNFFMEKYTQDNRQNTYQTPRTNFQYIFFPYEKLDHISNEKILTLTKKNVHKNRNRKLSPPHTRPKKEALKKIKTSGYIKYD
jgi:hypothetical protein